ncbi:hypothetical protein [Thermococcus henrietii]|uniref:hypothetical protein n=1 Tax=Thermococcus henrietii TaxID=2016361 RepID=UPI000C07E3F5|nr:hypothetical protein [Thermococcus henrietii]
MGLLIGSDEGDIKFVGRRGTFIARIGVAVTIRRSSYDSFLNLYREFFEDFKEDLNLKTPRWIFSSSDVRGFLIGRDNDPTEYFLRMKEFVEKVVVPGGVITNFIFASFGVKKISMPDGSQVGVMNFIKKKLGSYFSYIPAWVVLSRLGRSHPVVYIDNFNPSPRTLAWEKLCRDSRKLVVIPNGDKVNPLISTADLVLRYIKESMLLSKWRLDVPSLLKNLPSIGFAPDLLKVYHVGSRSLSKIVPVSTENDVLPQSWYPLPMIYVIREGLLPKNEQRLIEKSPAFEYILRHASEVGGSIKFLSLQSGAGGDVDELRRNGGILVSLGPYGHGIGEYLIALGFPVTHLTISELISKYGG